MLLKRIVIARAALIETAFEEFCKMVLICHPYRDDIPSVSDSKSRPYRNSTEKHCSIVPDNVLAKAFSNSKLPL